jgi:CubicO group peptidase (beta-lactamase class C family)
LDFLGKCLSSGDVGLWLISKVRVFRVNSDGPASWGLGMAVDIQRTEIFQSPGRFGLSGGFGTCAYTDPVERVIGILFTQRMPDSPEPPKVSVDAT